MLAKIVYLALTSRLLVFLLQVICNWIVPDHDADAFRRPTAPPSSNVVTYLFGGFAHWDAEYFLHIAEHGYTYENTLAFFPLYPHLVRCITDSVLDPLLCILLPYQSVLLLSGVLLNVFMFTIAAIALYHLTLILFDETAAMEATLLFCFNPASVFFSACYTESLFSATTFLGLYLLEFGQECLATVFFILGGFVRSNGFLSSGFLIFHTFIKWSQPWQSGCELVVKTGARVALCFAPYLLFQCYTWSLYCIPDRSVEHSDAVLQQASEHGYHLAGYNISEWCKNVLPFSYGYVQQKYWNVGFLRYYQLKQLPNFLLATPVVALLGSACFHFLKRNSKTFFPIRWKPGQGVAAEVRRLPYLLHVCILLTLCTLFVNVQVTTRLVAASSPVLYWATFLILDHHPARGAAVLLKGKWHQQLRVLWRTDFLRRRVLTFFALYFVLGTAMHVNRLPWT
ncbi:GPI mannosyltransferase 2-like [Ornithodoros turicata]|uniref:GPI mannosyltransferase 2-like n=1 Tax=Ornithodoros turicata TaxID=34597 RepID=UPI00313A4CF4